MELCRPSGVGVGHLRPDRANLPSMPRSYDTHVELFWGGPASPSALLAEAWGNRKLFRLDSRPRSHRCHRDSPVAPEARSVIRG